MAVEDRPSFIILRSHIGWPSPKFTDSEKAHGSPLGEDEIRVTKEILGLPPDEKFHVPDEVVAMYRECIERGQRLRSEQEKRLASWQGDRVELDACLDSRGLNGWEAKLPTYSPGDKKATRVASGECMNAVLDVVPGILAGGADLTGNTGTQLKDAGVQSKDDAAGRQIYYGIREHGMGGAMNGMAMHGGVLPVGGTFFVFSDYMRGAVRLAALSEAKVVYSWTHDSVGLGEDGPTHQPIEQIAAMRAMPQLRVIRPADANEVAHAWRVAVNSEGPTAMLLSRQDVPVLEGTAERADDVARGAYTLVSGGDDPDLILIGTGSEVWVCVEAARALEADGVRTSVVSMPSWELFDTQDEAYQDAVLPEEVPTLAVEAASSFGWDRFADDSVSIDHFGASAPGKEALERMGYTPENVVARAKELLDELRDED
jgi:transketolase